MSAKTPPWKFPLLKGGKGPHCAFWADARHFKSTAMSELAYTLRKAFATIDWVTVRDKMDGYEEFGKDLPSHTHSRVAAVEDIFEASDPLAAANALFVPRAPNWGLVGFDDLQREYFDKKFGKGGPMFGHWLAGKMDKAASHGVAVFLAFHAIGERPDSKIRKCFSHHFIGVEFASTNRCKLLESDAMNLHDVHLAPCAAYMRKRSVSPNTTFGLDENGDVVMGVYKANQKLYVTMVEPGKRFLFVSKGEVFSQFDYALEPVNRQMAKPKVDVMGFGFKVYPPDYFKAKLREKGVYAHPGSDNAMWRPGLPTVHCSTGCQSTKRLRRTRAMPSRNTTWTPLGT
jgi:hypothetical protein